MARLSGAILSDAEWGNAQLFTIKDAGGGFRTIVTPTGGGVISVSPTCAAVGCKDAHLAAGQPIDQLPLDKMTRPGAHQSLEVVEQACVFGDRQRFTMTFELPEQAISIIRHVIAAATGVGEDE